MTTIEAIKELREASDSEVRYGDTKRHYDEVMKRVEAFDMAIKALEEISRLPENLHREREQAYMNGYADAKSTCRWISVDDKLPEEDQRVLVIYRSLISDTEKMDIDFIKGKYWQNHSGVIAWMPLPEWEGMEYDEERNTMKIKKSAYDDAIERIDKSTFTLNDGLDCVETLVAMEAVMIASRQTQPCEDWKFYYNHGYAQAKKDLAREVCEDCISREYLINNISSVDGLENVENSNLFAKHYMDIVKSAPSVQPTRPTGKWIDIGDEGLVFKCSICGTKKTIESHFCPNCGARLEVEDEADN